jgi:hypothetical protein
VAKDRTSTQPPEPGVGTPPRGSGRDHDILHVEIAKIQSDGEYLKRDLGEMRTDMRDIRDRMATLEERVRHFPSKVAVVTTALLIAGALTTIAPRLWSWAGTTPIVTVPPTTGR